ncbi:MAG: DUF1800 family protein, partial [Bacteroidota bacterium]|nr:DUF1800 family protein [Bacteroidota bacterium]
MNNIKQVKHLWARAGFGMRFEELKELENISIKHAVKKLFDAPAAQPVDVVKVKADYAMLLKGDVTARKMFLQQQRQQEKDLNLTWINQMSTTGSVLQE